MGIQVRVKNPKTGEEEIMSPQNATDCIHHLGYKRLGNVEVSDDYVADATQLLEKMDKGTLISTKAVDPANPDPETAVETSPTDPSPATTDIATASDPSEKADEADTTSVTGDDTAPSAVDTARKNRSKRDRA